ncbi:MAG TPA: hypothetical protein VGO58_05110 [Chitinophagaceae bacterium]|nr:hypothetical protein [Chitinophagaceae bacterium]
MNKPYERFGRSVAMSGTIAVIGAYSEPAITVTPPGSASVYQFNGTEWVFVQKLVDWRKSSCVNRPYL